MQPIWQVTHFSVFRELLLQQCQVVGKELPHKIRVVWTWRFAHSTQLVPIEPPFKLWILMKFWCNDLVFFRDGPFDWSICCWCKPIKEILSSSLDMTPNYFPHLRVLTFNHIRVLSFRCLNLFGVWCVNPFLIRVGRVLLLLSLSLFSLGWESTWVILCHWRVLKVGAFLLHVRSPLPLACSSSTTSSYG